jgi:CheY-like chemotaxis protein
VENWTDLVRAVATLLWPLAVLWLLIRLTPHIKNILESRDFTVEVAGTKISVQRASDELSKSIDDLRTQLVELKSEREKPEPAPTQPRPIQTVLWVDDRREANVFEIASLRRRGVLVRQAASTEEARQVLSGGGIDLVISDMGRIEQGRRNPTAGLELLEQAPLPRPPFLFYTGDAPPELRHQVEVAGGAGITTSPTELFALIDKVGRLPREPAA